MLARINFSDRLMNQCAVYFPLVGLMLGAMYAGLYLALSEAWSPSTCLILVTGFHLCITGAFHEDGLADSVDAFLGLEHRGNFRRRSGLGPVRTEAARGLYR